MINIDGKKYKVIETLSFHQVGLPTKVIMTENGEKIVVKRAGKWTWWNPNDRLQKFSRPEGM